MSLLLQESKRFRVETEENAIALIQQIKDEATDYEVKKSSYTQKVKKSKGEIIDTFYWVDITLTYNME